MSFKSKTEKFRFHSIHSFCSTAIKGVASPYGTVPERTRRSEEQTRNTSTSNRIFNSNEAQSADMWCLQNCSWNTESWQFQIPFNQRVSIGFSFCGKSLCVFIYSDFYWVGAGISTLTTVSGGLSLEIFRRNMEKTRPMREKNDGKEFISHQSRYFLFIVFVFEILLPFWTLIWRLNNHNSCRKKQIDKRKYYFRENLVTLKFNWLSILTLVSF